MSITSDTPVAPMFFRARVRDVAEFCCRTGDLMRGSPAVRAEQGQEAQKKLQETVPDGYLREVTVSRLFQRDDVQLYLSGRIDGLWWEGDIPVIEEIKATLHTDASLPPGVHAVNLGQAMLYAALEPKVAAAAHIRLRLVYHPVDSGENFSRETVIACRALESWFLQVTGTYLDWLSLIASHRRQRDQSLTSAGFPWPDYRPGQRELMTHVWRTIKARQVSLVQAATGSGKTLSLLFPALKSLPEGSVGQVRFLTAKTSGQRSVLQALQLMGPSVTLCSVFPGARERLCPCLQKTPHPAPTAINPSDGPLFAAAMTAVPLCDRLTGYFERLPAARIDALDTLRLDAEGLQAVAERHRVCPHALAQEIAPWADLVVGDYNYQFDPGARLPDSQEPVLLLVDEAHNLADRARSMYSTRLYRHMITPLLEQAPPRRVRTLLRRMIHLMDAPPRTGADTVIVSDLPPQPLEGWLENLTEPFRAWLDLRRETLPPETETVWHAIQGLRRALQEWNKDWRFVTRAEGATAHIEAWCIDPSRFLASDFMASEAAFLFSGTLTPRDLHAVTLGLTRLPPERRGRDISTPHALKGTRLQAGILPWPMHFRQREATLPRFRTLLQTLLRHRPGRWLLCGPSHSVLRSLHDILIDAPTGHTLLLQEETSDGSRRTAWIDAFSGTECVLGCVIAGGVFAEGLDLADTPITGVVMAGFPVPPPSPERAALAQQLSSSGLDGPGMAWTQPALEKTLQSAGRLLRRDGDTGILLLVDARYAAPQLMRRLPAHWDTRCLPDEASFSRWLSTFSGQP